MNAISALGLKLQDLYHLTFEEFIEKNPEYKKLSKEIQKQRYNLYEEQRQSNEDRCKSKRLEIIANSKKISPTLNNNREYELDEKENDNYDFNNYGKFDLSQNYRSRNTDDNYLPRKSYSTKKRKFTQPNKIIVTEDSYILNDNEGKKPKVKLTKEELDKITCLQKEKEKLEKKNEKKDMQLKRFLQKEIEREKKLQKVKKKLDEKEQKINKFIKVRNRGIKQLEKDRYEDNQDIHERQKLYEKMLFNYDQKIYLSKQQQLEKNKNSNLNKISIETSKKMEELDRQIKDYERKNDEYKQKITNLFDLKEKEEMDKKIKERIDNKEKNKESSMKKQTSFHMIKKKLDDYEEKFEIEKYRRENALMVSMTKFQNKINSYLERNEKKEKKIKETILEEEKKKEERIMKKKDHFEEVRINAKKEEKKKEEKRQKWLEDIEKKNLKAFAIKQEKQKMYEERQKLNKLNQEERNALKLKIQEVFSRENNIKEGEKNDEFIQKLIDENSIDQN